MEKCKSYDEYVQERSLTDFERGMYFAKMGKYVTKVKETVSRCRGTKEYEPCTCGGDRLKCNFYDDVRKDARDELAKKAAEEPRCGKWISVKDKLPPKGINVIVCTTSRNIAIDYRYGNSEDVGRTEFRYSVTHWMPLPEPPKESEDRYDRSGYFFNDIASRNVRNGIGAADVGWRDMIYKQTERREKQDE